MLQETILNTGSKQLPTPMELDITAIWGIGATKKQWLAAIDIHTVPDLASAVVEEIEAKLRQKGYSVTGREILGWIVQAQDLMTTSVLPLADDNLADGLVGGLVDLEAAIDAVNLPAALPEPMEWHSLAGFQVRFQIGRKNDKLEKRTIVYDLNHKMVRTWQEWDNESIQEWIETRLQECIEEHPDELQCLELTESIVEEPYTPTIAVEVTYLRLLRSDWHQRPLVASHYYRSFSDKIQAGEPFDLEASIEFHGIDTAQLNPAQLVYQAQCYARHLATGATILLDELVVNVPASELSLYSVLFADLVLDQPGAYRLSVSISVQNAVSIAGQFRIPLLQVV